MLNLIHIDKRKRIPVFQQIADQIQELTLTKRIIDKSEFPSYLDFKEKFGLDTQEVDKIIDHLVVQKLLVKFEHNYLFISPIVSTKVVGKFKGIYPVFEAIGLKPSIQDIALSIVEDIHFSYEGQTYTLDKAWKIERLYLGSGRPLLHYEGYLPFHLFKDFEKTPYQNNRIYELFEKVYHYKIAQSLRMIFGKSLSPHEGQLLDYPVGSPAMVINFLNYNQKGDLIELTKLVTIADYFHIDIAID